MKLSEIRKRIEAARKRLEQIKPVIKCYLVVMINRVQFAPQELHPESYSLLKLMENPSVFLPGQKTDRIERCFEEIKALEREIKKLENAKSEKKKQELLKLEAEFEKNIRKYFPLAETMELHEPDCELRFFDLDIDKIQELKQHPLVQEIGKTDPWYGKIISIMRLSCNSGDVIPKE